jgi:hypothetical protein
VSHLSVRTLLEDVAKSLADKMQFGYGRRSEFNFKENKRYPFIWLLPLNATRRNNNGTVTKVWNIAILFLDKDAADSNDKQTAKIHDEMDVMVDRYVHNLEMWYLRESDTVGEITITNPNQQPFYKDDSDINSGWLLTFQLEVSDDFIYCTPENIELYAGNL